MTAQPELPIESEEYRLPRLPIGPRLAWRPAFLIGGNNKIVAPAWAYIYFKLTTLFLHGSHDNQILVGRGFRSRRLTLSIGGVGNRIEIGDDVTWTGHVQLCGFNAAIRIGDRCDGKGVTITAWEKSVHIGSDCLFADGIEIRTTDIHPIVDRATGKQVNEPEDVRIGDHVWVALHAVVLKGASIPDGCVVGMRSVVTAPFEEPNCLLVGNPARVVRSNIAWRR